jgi:hypothetical protein
MQTMLSIFQEQEKPRLENKASFCDFCGEYCQNDNWKQNNHSIIHNGWCTKAMMFHFRVHNNNPEEINWLVKNGIDPYRSRFEQSA